MTGFVESYPDVIVPNPGGVDDPLGESVLESSSAWLRCFEPKDLRLVIGRHQDPHRELLVDRARADGVPMHRRVAGGGAVVLGPGMVVVALRLKPRTVAPDQLFQLVNSALGPALQQVLGKAPIAHGHGDLTVEADGVERKVLGASLRQTARFAVYLGVFLIDDAVPLMERYLSMPSREPEYRAGRNHLDFCGHLAYWGVSTDILRSAVENSCRIRLAEHALV